MNYSNHESHEWTRIASRFALAAILMVNASGVMRYLCESVIIRGKLNIICVSICTNFNLLRSLKVGCISEILK